MEEHVEEQVAEQISDGWSDEEVEDKKEDEEISLHQRSRAEVGHKTLVLFELSIDPKVKVEILKKCMLKKYDFERLKWI